LLLSVAACGGGGEGNEQIDSSTGAIVRSTSNGGRDQVVLLYGIRTSGATILCSGSYKRRRTVLEWLLR